MNSSTSRIQLHEFTNSTSWIHEFNFMNSRCTSRIPLHEFNFTNSRFNFMNSRIHVFAWMRPIPKRIQLLNHEVALKLNSVNSWSWIEFVNSWSCLLVNPFKPRVPWLCCVLRNGSFDVLYVHNERFRMMRPTEKKWSYWHFLSLTSVTWLTHLSLGSHKRDIGKQCRPRSDAAERGVWSGSTLFALRTGISFKLGNNKS